MPESCCFDDWARNDARRARRRDRPDAVTRTLVAALGRVGLRDRSVLDVGCGAGELALACLDHGARRATGTDLSATAVEEATTLARERGHDERASFLAADGASAALRPHDVVALNRVICCYPDASRLVAHTSAAATRVYALVVPRSAGAAGLLTRASIRVGNLLFRLRRRHFGDYRAFVHDVATIDRQLRDAGLRRVHHQTVGVVWHLAVYERAR